MGRLFPLLALADLAVLVVALIDCLSVEEHEIRALPRIAWVFLIVLVSPIGGIAWFVAGRPERSGARAPDRAWRPGNGFPEAERPRRELAPDDDPEFLSRLAARDRSEDEARLRAWEDDLRRRERELREKDRPADDQATD
jgi:Phospholipase_D-nuclease N-terminal